MSYTSNINYKRFMTYAFSYLINSSKSLKIA